MNDNYPKPLYELVIEATCIYYKITREELFAKRAVQATIDKKQICFYIIKQETNLRLSAISRITGHSRTTLQSALEKVEGEKDIYRQVLDQINDIMVIVYNLHSKQKKQWGKRSQVIS